MQAIILAAGMGKRLKTLTHDNTKCMVKINGITLIERMLTQLDCLRLSRIVIVIGYQGDNLVDFIQTLNIKTPIRYITNSIYEKTNNIYSLALAKEELLEEDTLLLESDLIFDPSVLRALVDDPRETLALVDQFESWMDGTCVKLNVNDEITEFVPGSKFDFHDIKAYYKTVNIYKFSRHFSEKYYVPFLKAYCQALGDNEYYEDVLRVITLLDDPEIKAKRLSGENWYEIDDIQDLNIAESIFDTDDEHRLISMEKRYGGYWRYPDLLDFCYLVNPHYPPQRMMDEIKANFESLLTAYPSGMSVNCLIAARNFDIAPEHIVVGNGAAELIKECLAEIEGKIGVIRPTFEEYPNRLKPEQIIPFSTEAYDFHYSAEDLISFYDCTDIKCLLCINPDNPSGNYLCKSDLLKLIEWAKKKEIRLLVDESFVDFAEETDASLISEECLAKYKQLIVIKSISKSYGVPGLRLGIMASSDTEWITRIKKRLPIWNINSFAEFYLQIFEKYQKAYVQAMSEFKKDRQAMEAELSEIKGLRVLPSQANYLMVELPQGISSKNLTRDMLKRNAILLKDLSAKIINKDHQYIRVAIKKKEENTALIQALKVYLQE